MLAAPPHPDRAKARSGPRSGRGTLSPRRGEVKRRVCFAGVGPAAWQLRMRVEIVSRRLIDQPLEPARQHLAHHAEIVAGRKLGRFDVELAVLVLAKPSGPATIMAPTGLEPWMWLLS